MEYWGFPLMLQFSKRRALLAVSFRVSSIPWAVWAVPPVQCQLGLASGLSTAHIPAGLSRPCDRDPAGAQLPARLGET